MTLSIKNGGYAFLIRLDLMFSMSLWQEFQLLQILNDLSIRHLFKLILYENDVKLLKSKRSLREATSKTHFIFSSKFYNQIDGVAMGSPLAPVLAKIFMDFHESKWLNEYNPNKSEFYLRYVDDILAVLEFSVTIL